MSILRFFGPERTKIADSKFNKNISVIRYLSSSTVLVDGLIESGDIMSHIWKSGIDKLVPKFFKPNTVLLLGLAGGCNAKLINKRFPNAEITAVEIDPLMVDIGKKYFGLDQVKKLNIVVGDALDYVNQLQPKDHFDLVLVDCFEGRQIPKKLESLNFFQKLKDHSRMTLINRVYWMEHRQPTLEFMKSLSSQFFFVKIHTRSNIVISLV